MSKRLKAFFFFLLVNYYAKKLDYYKRKYGKLLQVTNYRFYPYKNVHNLSVKFINKKDLHHSL